MSPLILDEVYDVWFTSFWQTFPGYAILGIIGVVLALAGYGILTGVRIYRRGTTADRALRSLAMLIQQVERGNIPFSKAYQQLTDIAKSFSQWRYKMPHGVTDYELVNGLKKSNCTARQVKEVEQIISNAQVIKFGQIVAPKQQVLEDIAALSSFIKEAGVRLDN